MAKSEIPADIAMKVQQCKLSDVLPAERNNYSNMMGFNSSVLTKANPSAACVNAVYEQGFHNEDTSCDRELANVARKLDDLEDPLAFDANIDDEA